VPESMDASDCVIEPLRDEEDIRQCARMMVSSEPWITLKRTYEEALRLLHDAAREAYVARSSGHLVGFLILCMTGAFVGYIQTVCVDPRWRDRGFGSALVRFAEQRIFREQPNVFMCVSSFNLNAQRLYLRLGYEVVGELKNYVVPGLSEILLRKTIAPLKDWSPA
jgi:[ribosomal protein S18]-alanine N-acetyltransferase